MSESIVEIKKTQDDIAKLLNDFQDSHKKLVTEGKSNSEALVKMGDDFGKMSQKLQDSALAIEAEKKAREELELTIAKVQESGGDAKEVKSSPEYVKGFNDYCLYKRAMRQDIFDAEIKAMIKRESGRELTDEQLMGVKTLLVGSNPDGGYIVPTERQSAIIRRRFEQTPMRSVANQVTIGTTDTDFILDDGEFGSQKVGEVDLRVGTGTSQIGVITIPTHEQSAECVATEKVLDDAVWNLEAWLTGKIAQRFSRIENREFMVGSAAHEAQGICTIPDWVALGNYERNALETRTANGVTYGGVTYLVSGNDLIDVQTDLLEDYQGNAAWFFNRKSWAEICKLQDANGQYLLNPMMLFQGVSPQLLGARVLMSPDLNQFNQGGIVGLYGDFREGYAIVDRLGIRILRDPYTIKGFIVFWARKRTGGAVTNFQAIKRLRVSAST